MMLAFSLLMAVLLTAGSVEGVKKCSVVDGHKVEMFSGRSLNVKMPCKYNAVLQTCGDYKVTVTPGQRYLYPQYILDSLWISAVNEKTGQWWEGRTTNKLTALYILKSDQEPERVAFNKKGGNVETDDLFKVTRSNKDVTLEAKNGDFRVTFGAFDFTGGMNRDSRLEFVCNAETNELVAYPKQFCGSESGKELRDRSKTLFDNYRRSDLAMLYDAFTYTTVMQTEPSCQASVSILTQQCQNETERVNAIRTCQHILISDGHTQCVTKYACNPLDVFKDCLQFTCSGFEDKAACERLGQAIDMCRDFPELTPKVKAALCYKDLLTREDNKYYVEKEKKKQAKNDG